MLKSAEITTIYNKYDIIMDACTTYYKAGERRNGAPEPQRGSGFVALTSQPAPTKIVSNVFNTYQKTIMASQRLPHPRMTHPALTYDRGLSTKNNLEIPNLAATAE